MFWTSEFKNCLPKFSVVYHPTFNMVKVNGYDNRGKISRTSAKICECQKIIDTCSPTLKADQNLDCIALFKRRNKPQNVLNISGGTSNMASDMQVVYAL